MELVGKIVEEASSITMVADRESDIYEAFANRPTNVHLLTRAAQNRCLADGDYLFDALRKERIACRYKIDVLQKVKRKAQQTEVALRYGVVELRCPVMSRKTCAVPTVQLTAVFVEEIDPPQAKRPFGGCC